MRPNKALCVLGAVICASAALLIINNTKSEQDYITLDAVLLFEEKDFVCVWTDSLLSSWILFTEEYKSIRPIVNPLMR